MDKQYKPLSELKEYESNARDIDQESYGRLKDQLSLKGQFAPLLVMPDGTVLSGNMRLKAMRELGIEQAWIVTVDFIQKEDGLFRAVFESVEQVEPYATKEDGMLSWSLAHNADYGHYDFDKFANIKDNFGLDWNTFAVNFDTPNTIQELINNIAPENPGEQKYKYSVLVEVDSEERQKALYYELSNQSYNAKIKTTLSKKK